MSNNVGADNFGIDVMVPCFQKTEEFLYVCLQTLIATAKHKDKLHFLIGIDFNNNPIVGNVRETRIREICPSIEIHKILTGYPRSSKSHGTVINTLYKKCNNQYRFVIDSDIAFVYKNWDEILIEKISQSDAVAVAGIPYMGGPRQYSDFPCAMAMMFNNDKILTKNPNYLSDIDFCPILDTSSKELLVLDRIITEQNTKLYNKPIGATIRCDTGVEVYRLFCENQLTGYVIPVSNPKHKKFVRDEYQYNSLPFIVHFDGGSKTRFKSPKTQEWVNQIINWLLSNYKIDVSHLRNLYLENWFC